MAKHNRIGTCSICGKNYEGSHRTYCNPCWAEKSKKYRSARAYANVYQQRGILTPSPCEKCGSDENLEKHHDNYENPLDVQWLCRNCHKNHHSKKECECGAQRMKGQACCKTCRAVYMRRWRAQREAQRQLAMAALYEKAQREFPQEDYAAVIARWIIEARKT